MIPSREDWKHIKMIATMMMETEGTPGQMPSEDAIEIVSSYLGFRPVNLEEAYAIVTKDLGYE